MTKVDADAIQHLITRVWAVLPPLRSQAASTHYTRALSVRVSQTTDDPQTDGLPCRIHSLWS